MSLELPGRLGSWGPGEGRRVILYYMFTIGQRWGGRGFGNLRSILLHSDHTFGRI